MRRNFYLFISLFTAAQTLHASDMPNRSLIASEPCRGNVEEYREFLPYPKELTESISQRSESKILAKLQEFGQIQELLRTLASFNENEEEEEWEKTFRKYKELKGVHTYEHKFNSVELSEPEIVNDAQLKVSIISRAFKLAAIFLEKPKQLRKQRRATKETNSKEKHPALNKLSVSPTFLQPKKKKSKALSRDQKKKLNKKLQQTSGIELMNQFTKHNNQHTNLVKNLVDFLTGTKKEQPPLARYDSIAITQAFDKAVASYDFTAKLKEHKFDDCEKIIDTLEKAAFPLYSDLHAKEILKLKIVELDNQSWEAERKSIPYIIKQLEEKNQEYNSLPNGYAKIQVEDKISSLVSKLLKASPTNPEEKKSKAQFLKGFNKGDNEIGEEKLIAHIKGKTIKSSKSLQTQSNQLSDTLEDATRELSEYFPNNTLIMTLHNALNNKSEQLKGILRQQITNLQKHNKKCTEYITKDTETINILTKSISESVDEKTISTIEKQIQRLGESIKRYNEQMLDSNQKILENQKELESI